ncbi:MAG: long-chain-fatty-acid--CoA ligase [Thermaerobacter sp.]|nr:long-chain-fatty-acid--CoA ligase [Thermaerobacter sp.]
MEAPLTPLALVARGVRLYPGRTAAYDDDRTVTYEQFGERVEQLAGGLRRLGILPGDRVALLAPNTAQALECYSGVPLAGAILVPLNTRLSADEYRYILDHSGSRAVLVDAASYPLIASVLMERPDLLVVALREGASGTMTYEELLLSGDRVPLREESFGDERQVLSINYTSGTTARPKGVQLTHRNAYFNTVNMLLAMGLRREDVHLHVAPMFHANGWGFVWATLAVGAANVPLPVIDGEDALRRIATYGVTTLCAAPTVLTILMGAAHGKTREGVRVATAGAAPPAAVIRRVEEELGWTVHHFYGLTETTAFITYCEMPADLPQWELGPRTDFKARQGVALPLSGEVRVVRSDMRDVAADGQELGEVIARGNVIMQGYYKDADTTEQAMAGGWFHTGDLAVLHPDGYIEIRDRAKDVIISGGENIPSLEVESVLYRHPAVAQAAVVAAPHPHWGETPVAFVALKQGAHVSGDELTAHCRSHLTHFKVPSQIVFVSELPRTASGKIQKFVLRQQAQAGSAASPT